MKKILTIILSILAVCACAVTVTACDKDEGVIKLASSVSIEKFETANVLESYENLTGDIKWESSDSAVCTVSNGTVTALTVGKATITAKCGKAEATCKVEVTKTNRVPTLSIDKHNITLRNGGNVTLFPTLTYKNKVKEAELTYSSANESVAKIDETGKITAMGLGSTEITVYAKFGDVYVSELTSVRVIKDVEVLLQSYDVDLKLNTVIDPNGNIHQIVPTAYMNQQGVSSNYTYESDDSNIATVSASGLITAKSVGSTVIYVKTTVDGDEYTEKVNVNVYKSVDNVEKDIFEVFSGTTGKVRNANTITFDVGGYQLTQEDIATRKMTYVFDGVTYTVKNSYMPLRNNNTTCEFMGYEFGSKIYGEDVTLKFETDTIIVNVNIAKVVTKFIRTQTDLEDMICLGGANDQEVGMTYDGWFIMTNNIYVTGELARREANVDYTSYSSTSESSMGLYGFTGIFDGQGYTIYDLHVGSNNGGVFGNVHKTGAVKNLGLSEVVLEQADSTGSIATLGNTFAGELTNCYFDITLGEGTGSAVYSTIARNISKATFTDVVIKLNSINFTNGELSYLAYQVNNWPVYWSDQPTFLRVYVFLTDSNIKQANYGVTTWDGKTVIVSLTNVFRYGYNEEAKVDFDDSTYWLKENYQPLFKSAGSLYTNIDYVGSQYQTESFEAYTGVVGNVAVSNTFTVDLKDSIEGIEDETPSRIYFSNEKASTRISNFTFTNGVLSVSGSEFGSKVYGDVSVKIVTPNKTYFISSFKVVTKVISTFADLDAMVLYGGINSESTNKSYKGYFVLGNNIDCENQQFTYRNSSYIANFYKDPTTDATGFSGVFDGCGYTIKNIPAQPATSGTVFGTITQDGTVKNTAFVGKLGYHTNEWQRYGLVAGCLYGTLQNCYIEAVAEGNGPHSYSAPIIWVGNGAKIIDVVTKIDYTMLTSSVNASLCYGFYGSNTFTNVHSFIKLGSTLKSEITGITVYGYNDVPTDEITFTDSTYWNLDGDQPIFETAIVPV